MHGTLRFVPPQGGKEANPSEAGVLRRVTPNNFAHSLPDLLEFPEDILNYD